MLSLTHNLDRPIVEISSFVDAVYCYTFGIEENAIKVEIDSDNDSLINEAFCYCLGTDMKNKQVKKITGS